MGNPEEQKGTNQHVDSSLRSILISVLLVALAVGFVFGFKYFLKETSFLHIVEPQETEIEDAYGTRMVKDQNFKYEYVMIQDLKGKKIYASASPGEDDASSVYFKEGQILKVRMRGYIDNDPYYLLDNDLYMKDTPSLMPLKEYVTLKGYVNITYISSSGIQLRRWADFDADNIVESVYVGDKVDVKGKVITAEDISAFVTKDGYYMTDDSRYMNDHTTVVEEKNI